MDKVTSDLEKALKSGVTKTDLTKGIGAKLSKLIDNFQKEYSKIGELTQGGRLDFSKSKEGLDAGRKLLSIFSEIQRVTKSLSTKDALDLKKMFPQAFDDRLEGIKKNLNSLLGNLDKLDKAKTIKIEKSQDLEKAKKELFEIEEQLKELGDINQINLDNTQAKKTLDETSSQVEKLKEAIQSKLTLKIQTNEKELEEVNKELDEIEKKLKNKKVGGQTPIFSSDKKGNSLLGGKTKQQWLEDSSIKAQTKKSAQESFELYERQQSLKKRKDQIQDQRQFLPQLNAKISDADAGTKTGRKSILDGVKAAGLVGSEYEQASKQLTNYSKAQIDCAEKTRLLNEAQSKQQQILTKRNAIKELEADISKTADSITALAEKADLSKLIQQLKEIGLNNIEPEMLKSKESIEQLISGIDNLDKEKLSGLLNEIGKLEITTEKADNAADKAAEGFEKVGEKRADINRLESEMDNLKNQALSFFSLTNSVEIFKRALTSAYNTVKELDAAMTETAVVTDFSVGDMWNQLPKYTKAANDLGTTTLGAYETMTLFYQQGLDTNEVFEVGTETMKMAKIAGLDYADATNKMTAALRGFNMELSETSAQRVNDVYSELAAITAADTSEIANAMTKTASIANSANMEFETTAAFLSQIIETTRESAETAGTAMKTVIARFQELRKDPSEIGEVDGEIVDANKIETALRTVGVALRDSAGQFRDLDDVFLELASKWDGLDTNTQRYIATIAAGSRQQSRFIAMMSDYDRTMELVNAANNSAGSSQKQFEKTTESLGTALNRLSNAWDEFTMGLANNELIKTAVNLITELLGVVNKLTNVLPGTAGALAKVMVLWGGLKLGKGVVRKGFQSFAEMFNKDKVSTQVKSGSEEGTKKSFATVRNWWAKMTQEGVEAGIKKAQAKTKVENNIGSDVKNAGTKEQESQKRELFEKEKAAVELKTESAQTEATAAGKELATSVIEEKGDELETLAASEEVKTVTIEVSADTMEQIAANKEMESALREEMQSKLPGKKIDFVGNEGLGAGQFNLKGSGGFKNGMRGIGSSIKNWFTKNGTQISAIGGAIGGALLGEAMFDAFDDTDVGTAQIANATASNQKAIDEQLSSTRQIVNNFASMRDSLKQAGKEIVTLSRGTIEWSAAANQLKEQYDPIFNKFDELATNEFSEMRNGVRVLTEEGWAQYEVLVMQEQQQLQVASAQQKAAMASLEATETMERTGMDTTSISAAEQSTSETWGNYATIGSAVAGGATGMAIGATLGSAVPIVGTIIGGVLGTLAGGLIGGIVGAITDTGTRDGLNRQQSAKVVELATNMNFSAQSASEEEIQDFLNASDLTGDALGQLEEAIRNNAAAFDASTKAQQEANAAQFEAGYTEGQQMASENGLTGADAELFALSYGQNKDKNWEKAADSVGDDLEAIVEEKWPDAKIDPESGELSYDSDNFGLFRDYADAMGYDFVENEAAPFIDKATGDIVEVSDAMVASWARVQAINEKANQTAEDTYSRIQSVAGSSEEQKEMAVELLEFKHGMLGGLGNLDMAALSTLDNFSIDSLEALGFTEEEATSFYTQLGQHLIDNGIIDENQLDFDDKNNPIEKQIDKVVSVWLEGLELDPEDWNLERMITYEQNRQGLKQYGEGTGSAFQIYTEGMKQLDDSMFASAEQFAQVIEGFNSLDFTDKEEVASYINELQNMTGVSSQAIDVLQNIYDGLDEGGVFSKETSLTYLSALDVIKEKIEDSYVEYSQEDWQKLGAVVNDLQSLGKKFGVSVQEFTEGTETFYRLVGTYKDVNNVITMLMQQAEDNFENKLSYESAIQGAKPVLTEAIKTTNTEATRILNSKRYTREITWSQMFGQAEEMAKNYIDSYISAEAQYEPYKIEQLKKEWEGYGGSALRFFYENFDTSQQLENGDSRGLYSNNKNTELNYIRYMASIVGKTEASEPDSVKVLNGLNAISKKQFNESIDTFFGRYIKNADWYKETSKDWAYDYATGEYYISERQYLSDSELSQQESLSQMSISNWQNWGKTERVEFYKYLLGLDDETLNNLGGKFGINAGSLKQQFYNWAYSNAALTTSGKSIMDDLINLETMNYFSELRYFSDDYVASWAAQDDNKALQEAAMTILDMRLQEASLLEESELRILQAEEANGKRNLNNEEIAALKLHVLNLDKSSKALKGLQTAAQDYKDVLTTASGVAGTSDEGAVFGTMEWAKARGEITKMLEEYYDDFEVTNDFIKSKEVLQAMADIASDDYETRIKGQKALNELVAKQVASQGDTTEDSKEFWENIAKFKEQYEKDPLGFDVASFLTDLKYSQTELITFINTLNASGYKITIPVDLDFSNNGGKVTTTSMSTRIKDIRDTSIGDPQALDASSVEVSTAVVEKTELTFDFDSKNNTGGSDSKWENSYDKLYNTLRKIDEELRERNRLEREYDKLLKARGTTASQLSKNVDKQLAQLEQEAKLQRELIAGRTQQIKDELSEKSSLSKYATATFDEYGELQIRINWDEINKVTNQDLGEKIEKYIGNLETWADSINDANDTLEDIEDNTEELLEQGKAEYLEFETMIKDAIIKQYQDEIDSLSEINDSINNANSKLMEALQASVEQIRQDRENAEKEKELSDKEQRLAYLRQDTSGANALEIMNLEKEIKEGRQEYTDSLVDQKIADIQEQNNEAAEQRQQQIELAQAQLDWFVENGDIWTVVNNLIREGLDENGALIEDSVLANLLKDGADWKSLSEVQKMDWLKETNALIAEGMMWLMRMGSGFSLGEYDKNIDYSLKIQDAVKRGAFEEAAMWEAYRNYKIVTEGLDYDTTYDYQKFLKFKTGGLADFTGPAWLDGTKARPEMVLNQKDTQNFIQLKDVLGSVMKNKPSNENNGDVYYEIDINVEKISSDYDIDQVVDKIKRTIYEDAMYRNVNAIHLTR